MVFFSTTEGLILGVGLGAGLGARFVFFFFFGFGAGAGGGSAFGAVDPAAGVSPPVGVVDDDASTPALAAPPV